MFQEVFSPQNSENTNFSKGPIQTRIGGFKESVSDYSPQAQSVYKQQEPLQIKDAISEIGSNLKYIYSLNDQIRGLEDYSSTFFK